MKGDKCEYVGETDDGGIGLSGLVQSWLQPFLAPGYLGGSDGAQPVLTRNTVHPESYGLSPAMRPTPSIMKWIGADREGAPVKMPEVFQGMMGAPLGVMMGVPPGEPRDGSLSLTPQEMSAMARQLAPPSLEKERPPSRREGRADGVAGSPDEQAPLAEEG